MYDVWKNLVKTSIPLLEKEGGLRVGHYIQTRKQKYVYGIPHAVRSLHIKNQS